MALQRYSFLHKALTAAVNCLVMVIEALIIKYPVGLWIKMVILRVINYGNMNKILLLLISLTSAIIQAKGQTPKIDTVAVSILDRMSSMIGDLKSCSVIIKSNYDINSKDLGLVKHFDEQKLYLHGPDKLLEKSEGDKGTRTFSYNGKVLTYYSLDKNQYAQISLSGSIVEMIDSVNRRYGIEFTAADFFYPSFVDDILGESKTLVFLGISKVDDRECFHIAGTAKDKTFQFWISDDEFSLPLKMVIVYTSKENHPQYEAVLSGWQINPDLPDALFEFMPPHKAQKIKMASTTTLK